MSTRSHFSSNLSGERPGLAGLFPPSVIVRESRIPGNAADLLPPEIHHVERAVPKRVREFAAGRVCARSALAELGVHDFPLRAATDRQPIWPPDVVGSITHTDGYCAAAVASRRDLLAIGVDAEVQGAPTEELWTTICNPAELAWLNSLPPGAQPKAVTLLFAAKEAFYKCQYPLAAEWLDFHDLEVAATAWGAATGAFEVRPTRPIVFDRYAAMPLLGRYALDGPVLLAGVAVPAPPGTAL